MERKEDGWWFAIRDIECGPYVTKHEAIEDLQGLKRFLREHPEFGKSDTVFDPTLCPFFSGASVMPTATATKSSAKKSSSAKASKPSTKSAAKSSAKPAPKPSAKSESATHDGTKVGYEAKMKVDCKWNKSRVAFYKALRKIKGTGTADQIAAASGGELSRGLCLHYGYHGVAPGLNKVEQHEGVRGFTFTLTAKGKTIDLDAQLNK